MTLNPNPNTHANLLLPGFPLLRGREDNHRFVSEKVTDHPLADDPLPGGSGSLAPKLAVRRCLQARPALAHRGGVHTTS